MTARGRKARKGLEESTIELINVNSWMRAEMANIGFIGEYLESESVLINSEKSSLTY